MAVEQNARMSCGNVSSGLPREGLHRTAGFVARGPLARGSGIAHIGFWIVGSLGRACCLAMRGVAGVAGWEDAWVPCM
jgi:hypothetical protein